MILIHIFKLGLGSYNIIGIKTKILKLQRLKPNSSQTAKIKKDVITVRKRSYNYEMSPRESLFQNEKGRG